MEPPSSTTSLTPSSDADLPARIGGFHVIRRIATGGTSDVLLARAEGPHGFARVVVLKLLLPEYRHDEKLERMFATEAAAYARLSHPAIVKLFDFFSDSGQLVMVLEYVDGVALHKLRALLKACGAGLEDGAAMFVASRVFGALSAAHAARHPQTGEFAPVIHRDVNPSNVLIPWDGHAKIADFGIAKVAGVDSDRTQTGLVKGTYGYMSPEQARGDAVSVATDVYSGCLLVWELLSGRKAIVRGRTSDLDVLRAMVEPTFPSLSALRPDLPKHLLDAIALGLQPDPDRRAIHAEEMVQVLRAAIDLDEGRQRLVEALAAVRPPSPDDDLATTVAFRPPESADATIPKRMTLRGVSASEPREEVAPNSALAPRPVQVPAPEGRRAGVTLPLPPPPPSPPPPAAAPTARASEAPSPKAPPTAASAAAHLKTLTAHPASPAPMAVTARMPNRPQGTASSPPPQPPSPGPPPPPPVMAPLPPPRTPPPPPPGWTTSASAKMPAPAPIPVAWMPAPAQPRAHSGPLPSYEDVARPPGRRGLVVAIVLGLLACAGAIVVLTARARPTAYSPPAKTTTATASMPAPAPAPAPTPTPAPAPTPAPTPTPTPTPAPAPTSSTSRATTGTITVPPSQSGHRVWVDNRVVGESPGTFAVRCGWHSVRVGSQGALLNLEVPCDGDVVTAH